MATSPLVIGLGHRKGVGKDYFAKILRDKLRACGLSVSIMGFADALKREANWQFCNLGLHGYQFYEENPVLKDEPLFCGLTPRDIWKRFGNAIRDIHPCAWVNRLFEQVDDDPPDVLIIPDVRFPEEVEAIRARRGFLVKVEARYLEDPADEVDALLAHYGLWNMTVINFFTRDSLLAEAEQLIDSLKEKNYVRL